MDPRGDEITFGGQRRNVGPDGKQGYRRELTSLAEGRCEAFCPVFLGMEMLKGAFMIGEGQVLTFCEDVDDMCEVCH